MKLKLDEQGHAVIQDGHPVYVTDEGEKPVDVPAMATALTKANGEAAERRTALEQAQAELTRFKGLDPKAAREAIAFRKALGEDVDAGKVATEIADLKAREAGLTTQVEELEAQLGTARGEIDSLTVGNAISGSTFIREKVAPALRDEKLFRAAYGEHLHRDGDGRLVVKDATGNVIMSEKNPGKPAGLDEALPKIVTNRTHLAAGNASGGGGDGGNGDGGPKSAKKWGDLDREAQTKAIRDHGGFEEAQKAYS